MTGIPEQARTIAALRVIDDLVKRQQGADKTALLQALSELGIKGSVVAAMPDGTVLGKVTVIRGKKAAKVVDYEALTDWVEDNHPEHIVRSVSVRPAYLAVLLNASQKAGNPVDGNGDEIPGVVVIQGDPYLSTTLADGADQVVLDAIRTGALQPLALPGGDS